MKKCPFCAEEIQDAAIKCRFCNSSLTDAPVAGEPAAAPPAAVTAPALTPAVAKTPIAEVSDRKVIYEGSPSWKAYLGHDLLAIAAAAIVTLIGARIAPHETSVKGAMQSAELLVYIAPAGLAVLYMLGIMIYRRSIKFRVTGAAIETESGVLSKEIDVLQLWRIRDVRYKQNLVDRILGIAHVEVWAQDQTTPHTEIVGMPSSRELFEQLRDSIEIQRQARNVMGVVS